MGNALVIWLTTTSVFLPLFHGSFKFFMFSPTSLCLGEFQLNERRHYDPFRILSSFPTHHSSREISRTSSFPLNSGFSAHFPSPLLLPIRCCCYRGGSCSNAFAVLASAVTFYFCSYVKIYAGYQRLIRKHQSLDTFRVLSTTYRWLGEF